MKKYVIIVLVLWTVLYGLFSFYYLSVNPSAWSQEGRGLMALAFIMAAICPLPIITIENDNP